MTAQDMLRKSPQAILFADIHNYSRLMKRDEVQTLKRVDRAVRLIKSLIRDYGGEIKNVAGDGVLALFESTQQSVRFAVEMQREFRTDAVWNSESDPIAFRIGINVGEAYDTESGIQGHSVNIAARLQALAPPGGICITDAVKQEAKEIAGIRLESLGAPDLKNIDELIEIFSVTGGNEFRSATQTMVMRRETTGPIALESSIAVLPLDNLTGDVAISHVCDGLTGDIIANLTRFRDLHVIAQRSSSAFRDHSSSPAQIAKMLGVRYLVDGGFQMALNKIRLQIRLMDARSEQSLWSERFDGDLKDIFAFQDEVTAVIAARLSIEVSAAEQRKISTSPPRELEAYGLILRGRDVFLRRTREANLHARRLFEQAREIDPRYPRSYAGVSRTLNDAWRFNWADPPGPALDEAIRQAEFAVTLDPSDARGHAALGSACLYKRRYDESLAAYERAIEFNPNDADVLAEMGHSVCVNGDPERAITLIKRAMRLNPYYPDWYLWHLGEAHFDKSDYRLAVHTLNQMYDKTEAYRMLTASHALMGEMSEAQACAEQLRITHPEFTIKHWANVPPDRNSEPRDRLIEGLKKAGVK
jgi:adenylate cyclase